MDKKPKRVAFASWRCCSIIAETCEEIQKRCPEHDEYLLGKPEMIEPAEGVEMGVVCHLAPPSENSG